MTRIFPTLAVVLALWFCANAAYRMVEAWRVLG